MSNDSRTVRRIFGVFQSRKQSAVEVFSHFVKAVKIDRQIFAAFLTQQIILLFHTVVNHFDTAVDQPDIFDFSGGFFPDDRTAVGGIAQIIEFDITNFGRLFHAVVQNIFILYNAVKIAHFFRAIVHFERGSELRIGYKEAVSAAVVPAAGFAVVQLKIFIFGQRSFGRYDQILIAERIFRIALTEFKRCGNFFKVFAIHTAVKVSTNDSFAQTPPSADSYETSNLGVQIEKADYKLGQDGNVIGFICLNKEKSIKVEFVGERSYSTQMTQADRQAADLVYRLSQTLSVITQINKEIDEAKQKIAFIEKRMEERAHQTN